MEFPLPQDQIKNLKLFVELCRKDADLLHHPELAFFKNYLESLGAILPPKQTQENKTEKPKEGTKPVPEETRTPDPAPTESEESEVELDYEGVIQPDNDPPQTMGIADHEVTEEDIEKSNEKKREAIELVSDGKFEEAVNAYTEAILLNPNSALLYAKRGQCYLNLQKPNACIRDCVRALEINPDSAAAYKFRGRANRLLGNFVKAAEDLRNACKIDFDEQADEWLKEVTPNARKIEEHQRKYERKRLEKEMRETRERIRKMREEQQKRTAENPNPTDSDDEGVEGGPGGGMGDFLNLMKDPEVIQAFQDPEVAAAFQDISQNPSNIFKYQNNPKVNSVLKKLSSKFCGQMPGGFGGMPGGFGGFPGFGGAGAGAGAQPPPPPPKSGSDVDLD